MKVKKTCIVCGKTFVATNPKYCLCSEPCRRKRRNAYGRRYKNTHAELIRKQRKKYADLHKKKYHCKTCGEELPNGCQKYCIKCLLKAYQSEETRSWAANVLCSRGYNKEDIYEEIAERTSR